MSNTNNAQNIERESLGSGGAEEKKHFYTEIWFIVTVAVTACLLLVAMMVGIAMTSRGYTFKELLGITEKRMDFLKADLDKYIELKDSDYKDYELEINVPIPGEADVENEILKLLNKHKGGILNNGKYMLSEPITPGDKVNIFYSGYEINEKGERVELDGTSNYSSYKDGAVGDELIIGSGRFVPGFELGLVGKIPLDYSEFKLYKYGTVQENDVVYATLTYVEESGLIYDNANVRIDLRDPEAEEKWGVGILSYLQEKSIGITNEDLITLSRPSGDKITITRCHVNYVTKCEDKVITVKTVFPYDYSEPSFRSKTVYFDVFVTRVLCYENDELNDSFITEKLKISADSLATYEGENLVEKYRAYLAEELNLKYEENVSAAAEEAMWERLKKTVNIKELPEREVNRVYNDYLYSYRLEFEKANEENYDYTSFDEFMADYLGISRDSNWEELLLNSVKDEITEKLIFYSIIRKEGLVPNDTEFKDIYRAELEKDYFYYTQKGQDDFESAEEYEKAISEYEDMIIEHYGEAFYKDTVYYNYASSKIIKMATIVNKFK